ncbi:sugar ABC transporter ATP-binding protein [Schaalia sp. 19OD2882]|uniref:sugar ABC transporter ATP-binding protein n=1 Tax=Schaalia sp. 19OD2882 TaxID=2794089 RepID=UPI001C1F169C|nr:sugar ABC transporter ATP-binding protein [Schaalia sp. 19OD2882]QWW19645.1 sugar ABC transporter ATP-binding protein [Schaalia sp. 19OD2882]
MVTPFLTVSHVSKSFKGVHALQDINLEINPGEIHCLAGENGSGKSTLIKVVSGVYEADEGEIVIDGRSWSKLTPLEAIAAGVQVIYQDFAVFPNLSVMENLALTTEVAAGRKLVNWKRFRAIATEAAGKIGFEVDLDAKVGDLSVADKQLVAICRALMSDAKLIIMDEPTTALTKKEVAKLFEIILDLQKRGIAILFVSHKLEEVFEISERFTIIRSGKKVITCPSAELDRKSFAKHMTGRDFTDERFEVGELSERPALQVEDLTMQGAFEDVSFSIRGGEILGITGLLGSGRTELALSLFGAMKADSGTIIVDGTPVTLTTIRDAIAAGIAYVPEDRLTEGLFLERSIGDNIVISELHSFAKGLGALDFAALEAEQHKWVKDLAVATPDPHNAVNTLSGGNQQKVVLAKWLATRPKVLILNGPTVGVDIGSKYTINTILQNLAKQGMAVVVISDDIAEVLTNCNRVLIMRGGRLDASVDPATTSEKQLAEIMASDAGVEGVA